MLFGSIIGPSLDTSRLKCIILFWPHRLPDTCDAVDTIHAIHDRICMGGAICFEERRIRGPRSPTSIFLRANTETKISDILRNWDAVTSNTGRIYNYTGFHMHKLIKGIRYVSLYGQTIGYYIAAKRYMMGLKRSGIPFTWTPMARGNTRDRPLEPFTGSRMGDADLDPFCNKQIQYDTVILHTPPDLYPSWIEVEGNKRIFGYTVWETDKLPGHWPKLLNQVDHILVPCEWNKRVFEECGVTKPIDVIPHIACNADTSPSCDCKLPWNIAPSDFVFYTIETWTARKAVWDTIQCYLATFEEDDPVVLIVKTTGKAYRDSPFVFIPHRIAKILSRILKGSKKAIEIKNHIRGNDNPEDLLGSIKKKYNSPARIVLITDTLSENCIQELHSRGDCYVSLCRSEGWGLGAFKAAEIGKPVIITGFGGQLDFLPNESAYLIDYDLVSARDDSARQNFTQDQKWAKPRLDHASMLMRHVFENRIEAKARGEELKIYVAKHFQEDKVMQKFIRVLARS
ncbi:Uncharacterised protein [uncultured archaeon]|nr:Uncharacterised protein [uncultured archaeon]